MKTLFAILAVLILSISAAQSQTLNISTAGEIQSFPLNHPEGTYKGQLFDANWNLTHSVDENGISKVSGFLLIKNTTIEPRRFRASVSFQKRGGLANPFKYSGVMTLKGQADANGAIYNCPANIAKAVSPSANGVSLPRAFFFCPFVMTSSGAGTMQTYQVIQEQLAEFDAKTIGMLADINISDGDSLTFQPNIIFKQ